MPPGRDSFRRNRVAPFSTPPFYHSPQSNPIHQDSLNSLGRTGLHGLPAKIGAKRVTTAA